MKERPHGLYSLTRGSDKPVTVWYAGRDGHLNGKDLHSFYAYLEGNYYLLHSTSPVFKKDQEIEIVGHPTVESLTHEELSEFAPGVMKILADKGQQKIFQRRMNNGNAQNT